MLYNERAEMILKQLKLQSTVKVNELSSLLNVSVDTVRRDLRSMEQEGLIKCVRGGACLPESMVSLSSFNGREIINMDLKREASRKALAYIKDGDVVALNSGTTNTVLAGEMLELACDITVVTNNLAAADLLMRNGHIKLIVIGGMVDPLERSTFGTDCEKGFLSYHPDVAFLSINAVNHRDGYTDFRMGETGIIELLAGISRKTIALMDSSKLGKCSKKKVLSPDQADLLIMDDHVPEDIKKKYRKAGIEII